MIVHNLQILLNMLNSTHHYWKRWIIPKPRQAKVRIPPSLSALLDFNRNPFITIFEFSFLTWYAYSSCSVCIFLVYLQQCLSNHVRILWLTTTSWMNPFFSSVEENLIFLTNFYSEVYVTFLSFIYRWVIWALLLIYLA